MAANDYDDDDDESPFDRNGLLKDGRVARTPLMMRDGLSATQLAIMADKASRRFDDSACRNRPGPVYCDRSASREAYELAKAEASNAWRMLPEPAETADGRRRRKVTTRDPFGHETGKEEREEDAASVLPPTMDATEGRRRKQAAYDQMVADTCSAWRDLSPLPVATDAAPPPHRDAAPVPRIIRDAAEARQVKRAAYDEMVRESQDAWRNL